MIVAPDFFDHWKTKALVDLSQRPESPLWLLRLWAHCQTRKASTFTLPAIALKAICGVPREIDENKWFEWLRTAQFIDGTAKRWTVHDWDQHNAKLVTNWLNGSKAKVKPRGSQTKANAKPNTNPLPRGAGDGSDRVDGLDKKEKREGKHASTSPCRRPESVSEVLAFFGTLGAPEDLARDFFDHFSANDWTQGGRPEAPLADWHPEGEKWVRRWKREAAEKSSGGGAATPFNEGAPNAHTGGVPVAN